MAITGYLPLSLRRITVLTRSGKPGKYRDFADFPRERLLCRIMSSAVNVFVLLLFLRSVRDRETVRFVIERVLTCKLHLRHIALLLHVCPCGALFLYRLSSIVVFVLLMIVYLFIN